MGNLKNFKNIDENKNQLHSLFKSRDKLFELSYFMVEQYLSNKNENITLPKIKIKKN